MSASTRQPDSQTHQRRNAMIACIIAAIALGSTVPSAYEPFTRSSSWEVWANLLSGSVTTLVWLAGLYLAWRNRAELGVQLGLISSLIAIPATTFWTEGVGIANAVAVGVGVTIIAGVCLKPALARIYIGGAIIAALTTLVIDSWAPHPRLISNQDAFFINGVVLLAVLALVAFLFLQFPRYSLRTKLIIVFVGLAFFSTLAITIVATETIRSSLNENAARDLRTRAQSAALSVGITMKSNLDRMKTMSLDKSVQDDVALISDSYPAVAVEREGMIRADTERWDSADPQDAVIRNALNGELAFSLRQFGEVFGGNKQLFITDRFGSIIAATDWQPGYNFRNAEWWKIAYENGRGSVYIGQPEFEPMINEYGIRIALPIYAPGRQRAVGVLHGIYTLPAMQRALLLNSFGQSGKIDLLFPRGQILTPEGTFRALTPDEFREVQDGIGSPLATLNYRGTPLVSGQGVIGLLDDQPEPYLRASAWRTIATVQQEELLGTVQAGVQAALVAGLVAIAAAILIALVLAQFLTRPIRRLTATAEQVRGGDLGARAPVETGDEIGTLAQTFNGMTARLQDTLTGLERRVAERTQELSEANLTLKSHTAYLSALSDTSAGLFERLDLKELLQTIVERAGALVGTQHGFVFFTEPGGDEIQMRVGLGLYDDLVGTRAQRGVGLAGTVWQTGQPMSIEDYQKWEGRLPGSRRDALRAIVAVPLNRGKEHGAQDETVGVIGLAYTEPGRKFAKTEVEILQRFAQLAAIALDNAELYANSEDRVQELGALNTISQLIVQPYQFENVVGRIGDEIRKIFDADFGYFAIVNPDTHLIEFPYVVDEDERLAVEPLAMGEGIAGQVISSGQPIILSHASDADYERLGAVDTGDQTSPHSLMAVPIRSGADVIGALSVQRVAQDRPFTPEDQNLLTTIAASIGVGIRNVQLAQETQQQVAELSALNRIGSILNSTEPMTARLRAVGLELTRIFNVSSVYISLYDAGSNMIETPFYVEGGVEETVAPRQHAWGLVSHIIDSRAHLVINDHMQERFEELGGIWIGKEEQQTQSYLGTPLIAGDEVLGVIALNDLPEGRFSGSDVTFLTTISGAVATAIQNERLAKATERRLAELAALNTISSVLTTDEPLSARLTQVGHELHTIFNVTSVYIALYDASTNLVRMPFFTGDNQEYTIDPFPLGPGFTSHIIKTRAPLLINDNIEEQIKAMEALSAGEGEQAQSYMGVPLVLGDNVLGVVGISDMPKNKFQESDVDLLGTIASAIATAIQNTRLLEQTQERARELDAVNSLAREITRQRSLDDLFQEVYLQAKSVTSADGLIISLYDEATDTLTVPFLMDEGKRYEITPEALAFEREYADQVRRGEALLINNTPEEVAELDKSEAVAGGGRASRSRLYVPLMAGVRFLGMISLHSYEYDAYTTRDVAVLSGLASHISVALENSRLFEETQAALAETNHLYRIAEAANVETDELAFYDRVHEIVGQALSATNFLVALYNANDGTIDLEYYADEKDTMPEMPLRRIQVGTGITAYVLRTREPLLATRTEIHALAERGELELHGGESETWLGVPMMRSDHPIGVVAVQSYDPAFQYTERDKQTLIHLSQGIANAIERKRAEAALRRSEAQLAETMRITHLGNWEYDLASDSFTFTDQFYGMLRTSAEREGGYNMRWKDYALKFIHPGDVSIVERELRKAVESPDPHYEQQLDHRAIMGDGQAGYVTMRLRVIKDPQNRTVKTYGANLDITERKRAEIELQAALAETQRLEAQAREAAQQVSALNRRLTREGWRDYLHALNSRMAMEASGDENAGNGSHAPVDGDGANGRSTILVPIELRGEVIGEIELEYDELEQGWSEDRQAIVDDVAEHLGIVLDNARLYQQSQAALDETRRLAEREKRAAEISDRIYTATDVKTILRIATEELRRTTGSSRAVVKLNRDVTGS